MICSEHELVETIKACKKVIVYGAEARGSILIEQIESYTMYVNISVVVSNTYGGTSHCAGYLIEDIETYKNAGDSCCVLIAARLRFQNEMEANARSLGFSNINQISEPLFSDLYLKHNIRLTHRLHKKNQFLQYQTMNLMRLKHLQDKVSLGKKVRVVFILTNETKFNFESIYHSMEKNPLFEVIIFIFDEIYYEEGYYSSNKSDNTDKLKETREYAHKLKLGGFNVVYGYDDNNNAISIDEQNPDIIIYNACHLEPNFTKRPEMMPHYLRRVISKYLSCYLSYGMLISSSYNYHFENDNILPAWLYFIGNRQEYFLAVNNSITDGLYNVLSGHPLFDPFTSKLDFSLPPKLNNKKKIIIYAPHWSFATRFSSSFHIFGQRILAFLQEYPDIGFVFKPHPRLESEIREKEKLNNKKYPTYSQYIEYCRAWENSPNGVIVNGSSYIEWFRSSDCLITDSFSFILTWLPTDKPCIYLQNPAITAKDFFKNYLEYLKPVLESYYLCNSEENIKKLVEDVVINGTDVKAEERKRQKDSVIYNLGNAGEYIANYIEQQLRG